MDYSLSFPRFLDAIGIEPDARAVAAADVAVPSARALRDGTFFDGCDAKAALARACRYAYETRGEWRAAGIPYDVWRDTMSDIGIWQRTFRDECGEIGLGETGWIVLHLSRGIFRLGRLQFAPQMSDAERDGLPPGTPTLWVHIPRGDALTPAAVDDSLRRARAFFSDPAAFPQWSGARAVPPVFVCESWILSPRVVALLPAGNLLAFARRFRVVRTDETSRSAERYVFTRVGDPAAYPETTSLQRAVRRAVLDGGPLGVAFGILDG